MTEKNKSPRAIRKWLKNNLTSKVHIEALIVQYKDDKPYIKSMKRELTYVKACIKKGKELINKWEKNPDMRLITAEFHNFLFRCSSGAGKTSHSIILNKEVAHGY